MIFNVANVRKSLKMTQDELAEASGVSRPIIYKLESGNPDANTTTETLEKLAKAMGCSVKKLFFDDDA